MFKRKRLKTNIDTLFFQAYDFSPDPEILKLIEQNSRAFPAKTLAYVEPDTHIVEGETSLSIPSMEEMVLRKLAEDNSKIPCKIYRREGRIGKYVKTISGSMPVYDVDVPGENKPWTSPLNGAKNSCVSCAHFTMANMPETACDFSHRIQARVIRRPYCMKAIFPEFTQWDILNAFRQNPDIEKIQDNDGWLDEGWIEKLQSVWNTLTGSDLKGLRGEHVRYIVSKTEEVSALCRFKKVWDKEVDEGGKKIPAWVSRALNWVR